MRLRREELRFFRAWPYHILPALDASPGLSLHHSAQTLIDQFGWLHDLGTVSNPAGSGSSALLPATARGSWWASPLGNRGLEFLLGQFMANSGINDRSGCQSFISHTVTAGKS